MSEIESNVSAFLKQLDSLTKSALEEIGAEFESAAARATPVGQVNGGKTKGAWQHKVIDDSVLIGNTEETAVWLEFGTGDYALNKDGRKGGWWIPIGNGAGQIPEQVVNEYHFKIGYGKDGKRYAFTRGMKPQRILHNTVEKNKPKIGKIFKNKLGG